MSTNIDDKLATLYHLKLMYDVLTNKIEALDNTLIATDEEAESYLNMEEIGALDNTLIATDEETESYLNMEV